jgi:8-oxo-dGTP diphosphatase
MPHLHTKPGQADFTASAYIVCDGKVLLRKHDKYGIWISVGGHIEHDEDPNQAVIREVKEEVGLDVVLHHPYPYTALSANPQTRELIPPYFVNRHPITDDHDHIDLVYLATSKTQKVTPEQPQDEWRWLTRAEIERGELSLDPAVSHYALTALDKLG